MYYLACKYLATLLHSSVVACIQKHSIFYAFFQHELCEGQLDTKIRTYIHTYIHKYIHTYGYMNLQYGHFWTPDVIKQKTIPFPTSVFDFWANSIVGFLIGKSTKNVFMRGGKIVIIFSPAVQKFGCWRIARVYDEVLLLFCIMCCSFPPKKVNVNVEK